LYHRSNKIEKILKQIIMETKTNNSTMAILAVLALAFGVALLGWSLWMLPSEPAWGFPWAFTGAVLAFLPIAVGGWCLNALAMRRKDELYKYGCGGHDGNGGAITFALVVIVAGVLLLCFNSGLLPIEWRRVFFSLQMLLLVGSMVEIARRHFTCGAILFAVGGFFIIRRLAPIYPDIAANGAMASFWPVLLIIAGVMILGGIIFKPRLGYCCHSHSKCHKRDGDNLHVNSTRLSGVIDITTVFGGSEQVYLDPVFRGGKISTVFGGVKLDLRRTELPEGVTYLTIESVFGGVEIDTPEEWAIEIRNESVFGGFSDKRLPAVGKGYTDGRKLVVRASNVFGGGEIK
jgi:predicted membrane protein